VRQTPPEALRSPRAGHLHAGTIVGVYGVRGWVKIRSFTDPQENLLGFGTWFLEGQGRYETAAILEGRPHGKGLIARLEGIESREDAERLRGRRLWVDSEELPALEEDDYYWHQLIGMQVWNDNEGTPQLFGVVGSLIETGANDVLVVQPCEGSIDKRERLIPYLMGRVVERIDREGQRIDVQWHPDD